MAKKVGLLFILLLSFAMTAQNLSTDFRSKRVIVTKDTIRFDSVPINPQRFKVINNQSRVINPSEYEVLFNESTLILNARKYPEITIEYFRFPSFLTKTYTPFDKKLIVPNTSNIKKLYSLTTNKKSTNIKLFDGLQTSGFISRGFTSGNNQSTVANSAMDLNILGKLSKNVNIRANIFDTNIPLQENGYSQSITDFDRIFIEIFSKNWRVKAGDVSLENRDSYFLNFQKQVSGLEVEANISENAKVSVSGAIVRGQFTAYNFVGREGNQGPYKIFGPNNEPNIVIIAGSEKVFINGSQITRGENNDYVIDYNMGELIFNTTFPVTNDMRVRIEFQFTDRNYTRFVTYEEGSFKSDKFSISGYFYNENDAKNSPIQVSLTDSQKQILANAGNNQDLMIAESAFEDTFERNKILYRKTIVGAVEVFEYSTDETEQLFNVSFTNVGVNKGSYNLDETLANGNIFVYVGQNQGSFSPITRLTAPTKLQVAAVKSDYQPTEKTRLSAEIAISNNDQNLFSSIDNNQNNGAAAQLKWNQIISKKKWKISSDINYKFIHENFATVQRFQEVEFARDWNLFNISGNQQQLETGVSLRDENDNYANYTFNFLKFGDSFSGNKHVLRSKLNLSNTSFYFNGSVLNNTSSISDNQFIRILGKIEQSFGKSWLGGIVNTESNDRKDKISQNFIDNSHRYNDYEAYFGVGDSTKVYAKIGVNYRNNDSIRNNQFTEINNRKTFYLQSKLIQNKKTNLTVFVNYRITENALLEDEKTLNSRVTYNQRLANNFISLGTVYETSSGNVARQDYIYVEVEPGQGFYTWIDYNNNGTQEFDEFEIAEFQDQANYLRLPLPNLRYIATQSAKWKQSLTFNFLGWQQEAGFKELLSHFYNQTFVSIDNEKLREDSFNFNPFDTNNENQISLNSSFRNSFFFNRNRQHYSTTYTYGNSENKQQFIIGIQNNKSNIHQLEFQHNFNKIWLLDVLGKISKNRLETENFANRNYEIKGFEFQPKISYTYNLDNRFSAFYHYKNKENLLQDFEKLEQQKIGLEYVYLGKKKSQVTADINAFFNKFSGNTNTPVGYQMLEGLQDGTNITWNILWNQKLNSFLNLNLNYFGRSNKNIRTIHSGSIQLRAVF